MASPVLHEGTESPEDMLLPAISTLHHSVCHTLRFAGMQAIGPIAEQPIAQFEQVLDTNCTGAVRMMQAVTPDMLKQVRHAHAPVCSPVI